MLDVITVIAPVFLIIGAGYLAVRLLGFGAEAVDGLMSFAVRFAIPMLLFGAIYRLDLGAVFDWRLLASFYSGAVICFVLAIILSRTVWGRRPGEAVAIGFCALFSNSVLLGLPIMTRAYGADALAPTYAILSIHAPICYLLGIFTMELSRRDGSGLFATLRRAGVSMFSNALTIGLMLGFTANLTALVIPRPVMNAVDMMATAALPAALFGLGGALTRYALKADFGVAAMAASLSIMVHPAIAYGLTQHVFGLPEGWVRAAVVTAAMPTGMNGYVFATMYGRAQAAAASTVLLGTGCAVISVTFWLWLLGGTG